MGLTFYHGDPVKVDYTPGSAVTAGDVVALGDVVGIAHTDIAANAKGALAISDGVYKGVGDGVIAAGKRVYWDAGAGKVTLTAGANKYLGISASACGGDGQAITVFHHHTPSLGIPANVTITPAAGGANVSLVTFQAKDAAGNNLAYPTPLTVYLSDAATGAGLTATTASGAVAAGASGTDLAALVAKKALSVQTDATGKYILSITDTGKTGFYPACYIPGRGAPVVGGQLVAGNYG